MKQSPVPAFLTKLWTLVNDCCTNDLVSWSEDGCSFVVLDEQRFSKEILPLYYKHSNMTSFIRQLNMYGFHKVVPVDPGLLKGSVEFQHQNFRKDQPHLLSLIHRKVSVSRVDDAGQISQVLVEISHVQGWQDSFDFKVMALCRDNQSLWRELHSLQQKHQQQHKIIRKIMQFIINIVESNGVKGLKRKLPMIDSSGVTHSAPKYSRSADSSVDSNPSSTLMQEIPSLQDIPQLDLMSADVYSNGMIVSDITHLLEPLPEQDSGPAVESPPSCPATPLSPALSVDLALSLLDDPVGQETEEKQPERNEAMDPLSLIESSLSTIQASPLSPSLDILAELFRPTCCDSHPSTLKRKQDTRGANTHSHTYTVSKVKQQQQEVQSFIEDLEEADFLPSLLELAQEASIPLHTDTLQ